MGQENVFERRERRDELIGLEDEADCLAAHLRELVFREVADGGSVQVHHAGGWRIEPGEKAEQRRFSTAGGAHDRDKLAAGNTEVQPLEDIDGSGAVAYGFPQPFYDDHGLGEVRLLVHQFGPSMGAGADAAAGLHMFDTLKR